jgi:hypothetical protein
MSHGLRLDFSWTYSKSFDLGSDTERTNSHGTTSTTTAMLRGTSTGRTHCATQIQTHRWRTTRMTARSASIADAHRSASGAAFFEIRPSARTCQKLIGFARRSVVRGDFRDGREIFVAVALRNRLLKNGYRGGRSLQRDLLLRAFGDRI